MKSVNFLLSQAVTEQLMSWSCHVCLHAWLHFLMISDLIISVLSVNTHWSVSGHMCQCPMSHRGHQSICVSLMSPCRHLCISDLLSPCILSGEWWIMISASNHYQLPSYHDHHQKHLLENTFCAIIASIFIRLTWIWSQQLYPLSE